MKINEVITKYYDQLLSRAKKHNSNGLERNYEDVLHDVLFKAINKYKDNEVNEEEALHYIWRVMFFESKWENCRSPFIYENLDNIDDIIDTTEMEEF